MISLGAAAVNAGSDLARKDTPVIRCERSVRAPNCRTMHTRWYSSPSTSLVVTFDFQAIYLNREFEKG